MTEHLWIAVSISCSACDSVGSAVFDHEPTPEEIEKLKESIGGMFCINTHVFKGGVNQLGVVVE